MPRLSSDRRAIRAAARRLARDFRDDPNVTHVSVGWKYVGAARTDQLAIKVHVLEKLPARAATVAVSDVFVANDTRFATDVVAIGERPSLSALGCGDQVLAFDNDIGINGLAFTKAGRSYVLTNAHVVCDVAQGGMTGPVSAYNGSIAAATRLGEVAYASRLTDDAMVTEDAAAVAVDDPASVTPYRISYDGSTVDKNGLIQPQLGPYWFASAGELFTCDDPEPVDGPATVTVDGVDLIYGRFWQLRMTGGRMRHGLSGSLLCRRTGNQTTACGLVFGQASSEYAWVFQFLPLYENVRTHLP